MKTLNYIVMAALAAMVGCKQTPTVEDMQKLGEASGYTTAYVLNNQVKVDDSTRNCIIGVLTEAEKYVPAAGQTYEQAWTPIAQAFVDKAVTDGKITQAVADRVMKDFGYITGLLDKYIEKKGIADEKDLVNAFVHSFCGSFLTNFKPANCFSTGVDQEKLDADTIRILNQIIK